MNILEQIQMTALLFPERAAMHTEEGSISYGELDAASTRLAYTLQNLCGADKTPVPVYGHKSPEMLIAFLACVKSGRGYCPVDISVPPARVKSILEAVDAPLILSCEPFPPEALPSASLRIFTKEEIQKTISSAEGPKLSESLRPVSGDETFYMIFTSGSTGTPKGVQISSNCLNNYLDWSVTLGNAAEKKQGQIFLNQAPFSFDLSVMDLYTCLACGGTLYTLSKKTQEDFGRLIPALKESQASVWVSTPSFADVCLADPSFSSDLLPNLDVFLFCGETLTNRTAARLQGRFPNSVIMNTYGPTESTVAVTEIPVTPERNASESPLPVGYARPGTWIEIHDENGKPVPEGEKGEIILIGDTVSTGYYKQPSLTEKAFFCTEKDGQSFRGYRTGDEGYLKNGLLYYCGRIDLQVKLNGYRIELEDIESNLRNLPDIENAVAVPCIRNGKVKSIAAFAVLRSRPENDADTVQNIKNQLRQFLPDYMIPKKILFLDRIPMTANGKADRKKLRGMLS